jgi:plastocyanin
MFHYTVQIAVDPPNMFQPQSSQPSEGNFVYTPALLHVQAGDYVTWKSDNQFTLTFKDDTPIGAMDVFCKQSGTGYESDPYEILPARGQFHYAVAAIHNGKMFVDAACPRISVN